MNLSAVILAGGHSRRMGQDKAWLELGGRALLARALSTVRDASIEEIFISGHPGADYSTLRCPVLLDLQPGCGPLGGIERALEASRAPLLLVLAVDLPRMTAAFLRKLAAHCDPVTGALPELCGQLEPLAAIYPKRCRFIARDRLLKGHHAARHFAEACLRDGALKTFSVNRVDGGCFSNWNTPADISSLASGAS